jgi:hypothetical protein
VHNERDVRIGTVSETHLDIDKEFDQRAISLSR